MKPSDVRKRILDDHTALRRHLCELELAVEAMLADAKEAGAVRAIASQVLFDLNRHTQLEDTILVPVLQDIDAWGSVRVDQLLNHHEEQRAQIRELAELYTLPFPPDDLAQATFAFVKVLREDMEHEEQGILSVDLLRDDLITVAAESG